MTQLFTHTAMANQSFGSTIVPSASSLWSTYISFTTSVLLIRTTLDNFFPPRLRNFLYRKLLLFLSSPSTLTLVIEQNGGIDNNQLYSAAETYLSSKINPDIQRLRVSKNAGEDNTTLHFDRDEKVKDTFEEIDVNWVFVCRASQPMGGHSLGHHHHGMEESSFSSKQECRYFELSFDKKHKEKVLGSYLPYILERSKAIKDAEKVVRLYTYSKYNGSYGNSWDSVVFRHPSTFETLAMDEKQKKYIMDDLDRFVRRKGFYKKVGRAWKRGYLLYGPPGTGKSSLIAAMANYLKFSVYDLQLTNITRDADLRKLMLSTSNKSILVIEDIDCSVDDLHLDRTKRVNDLHNRKIDPQLSLSGLLNFIDGLWSSCGDERIIVFTTNYKDKIDPALLRPGRMDMHIHMSYCTPQAFETLATNYLGVSGHRHRLLPEIESMLQIVKVTPAEVAEELMKSEDADVSLVEVVNLLKRKRTDAQEVKEGEEDKTIENKDEDVDRSSKRQKVVEQFNGPLYLTLS